MSPGTAAMGGPPIPAKSGAGPGRPREAAEDTPPAVVEFGRGKEFLLGQTGLGGDPGPKAEPGHSLKMTPPPREPGSEKLTRENPKPRDSPGVSRESARGPSARPWFTRAQDGRNTTGASGRRVRLNPEERRIKLKINCRCRTGETVEGSESGQR